MFLSLPSTTRSEIPPWMLCVSERARFRDGNAGDRKCFCVVHQQASLSFQRDLIQAKFNPLVNEALTFLPELSSKHGGVGCTGRGFLGVMAAVQGDGCALCHPSLAAQLTSLCFRPESPEPWCCGAAASGTVQRHCCLPCAPLTPWLCTQAFIARAAHGTQVSVQPVLHGVPSSGVAALERALDHNPA